MKFQLTFKTPDVANDLLLSIEAKIVDADQDGDSDEFDRLVVLEKNIKDTLDKFIEYGELITVEFDTVEKTATVV